MPSSSCLTKRVRFYGLDSMAWILWLGSHSLDPIAWILMIRILWLGIYDLDPGSNIWERLLESLRVGARR